MPAGSMMLGAVDLMSGGLDIDALATDAGTSWGNAQPVETTLASFIQAGSFVVASGVEDREVTIAVSLDGVDGYELAAREASIAAELGKPNTLTYTPPSGPAQLFRVYTSNLIATPDDLREVTAGQRLFTIRLVCEPYVYSAVETYTPAVAVLTTVSNTIIDDGSSTTGWSVLDNPNTTETVTSSNGAVVATSTRPASNNPDAFTTAGIRSLSFAMTAAQPYLAIDWRADNNGSALTDQKILVNDTVMAPLLTQVLPNGFTRWWVQPGIGSVTRLDMRMNNYWNGTSYDRVASVSVDQVFRSNSYQQNMTGKQVQRSITVGGSAPTVGSIEIAHTSASLGDVLFYTCPADNSGYQPALRPFRTTTLPGSSTTTPVAADNTVSGYYDLLNSSTRGIYFQVPVASVPDGEYLVVVRATTDPNTSVTLYASTYMGDMLVNPNVTMTSTLPAVSSYTFFRLGMVHLPTARTGTNGRVTIALIQNSGAIAVDDVYLFNLSTGDLTQVPCGMGTPASNGDSNRVWIDSPSLANNGLGDLQRGTQIDRTDSKSAYPVAVAAGIHRFAPPAVNAFLITTNTAGATVGFRHNQAWLHNPAA